MPDHTASEQKKNRKSGGRKQSSTMVENPKAKKKTNVKRRGKRK